MRNHTDSQPESSLIKRRSIATAYEKRRSVWGHYKDCALSNCFASDQGHLPACYCPIWVRTSYGSIARRNHNSAIQITNIGRCGAIVGRYNLTWPIRRGSKPFSAWSNMLMD